MSDARVAIIIPAYNVERYIRRCLDSVISQSYENIEILLVDDGSTDSTGIICDEYGVKDDRFRVYHKVNGGLSDARNYALDRLDEDIKYVTFIDSDDWVSRFYIENLYNAIKLTQSEMSAASFNEVFNEDFNTPKRADLINLKKVNNQTYLMRLLYQDHAEFSAGAKMYEKKTFENLRYPVGELYEDIPVTYQTIKNSLSIAMIDNVDYYYYQRSSSIQNMTFNIRKLDCVKNCHKLMNNVKNDFPGLSDAAECRYLSGVFNILFQIPENGKYERIRKDLWHEVEKYRKDVIRDIKARKKTRAACFLSYFGYRLTEFIYRKTQWRGAEIKKEEHEP